MKHTGKILSVLLIVMVLACLLVACGGNETPTPTPTPTPGPGTTPGDGTGTSLTVSVSEVDFLKGAFAMNTDSTGTTVLSIAYDGEPHRLTENNHEGKPDPDRAALTYEYYDANGNKIASYDEFLTPLEGTPAEYAEGITEAGTYEVKLVYNYPNYNPGVKTAKFVITTSYEINYAVGAPTTAGTPQMTVPVGNPTHFTESDYEVPLYNPTMFDENVGYNFRGWYTDAACTEANKIVEINGDQIDFSLLVNNTLTLYAKFEACVAYPPIFVDSTSTTDGRVTTEPTQLPAIPGYDAIASDAYKLVDMSVLSEKGEGMGYAYQTVSSENNKGGIYGIAKDPSVLTAGGEYVIQWQDPSDLWDKLIYNETEKTHVPNDKWFGAMMSFASPNYNYNYADYDTIEFWIYNANNVGNIITMLAFQERYDGSSMYVDIPLDFSGWKKITLHISDFGSSGGGFSTMNISKINFYGVHMGSQFHSNNANLGDDKNPNFVYFSDIFLTNNSSTYGGKSTAGFVPNNSEAAKLVANLGNLPVYASCDDAEIAAHLEMLADNSTTDTGSFWMDIFPTDSYNIMLSYQRLMQLSEAWSDPDSDYYHSAELLDTIAAGMNYMTEGAFTVVESNATPDEYFEEAAYYIVKTTNNISSYINTRHAESWMVPVLRFVLGPTGEGNRLFKTAYTYACANAAIGNSRGVVTGVRAIAAAMHNNRATLAMNASDMVDAMSLLLAMKGTPFIPGTTTALYGSVFDWFYNCIDPMLVNGVVPTEIASLPGFVSLETYIRSMLMLYDNFTNDQKNKFAATVLYYMEQNPDLADSLEANAYFRTETTALTNLMSRNVTAADYENRTTATLIFENIGQVFYKNAEGYLLIDRTGTTINAAISALDHDKIYVAAINDTITIVADDRAIVLANGTVVGEEYFGTENRYEVFSYTNAAGQTTNIAVVADTTVTISESTENGTVMRASGAPMIVGSSVGADGKLSLTFYNFTDATGEISFAVKGLYTGVSSDNLYTVTPDTERDMTTVKFDLSLVLTPIPNKKDATKTTRRTTESVFEIVLDVKPVTP